ncbi:hypothetical protein B0H16DRAFT_1480413 [Mycena metata]|uniref:Uncharacterized protein n=1 Tax=Mycena metata TaxID=1033252 RepID=A0AAD7H4J6_9AGAR|nr:hypothetical protein B0H16DRAFT_1480413 [Mycena metata]
MKLGSTPSTPALASKFERVQQPAQALYNFCGVLPQVQSSSQHLIETHVSALRSHFMCLNPRARRDQSSNPRLEFPSREGHGRRYGRGKGKGWMGETRRGGKREKGGTCGAVWIWGRGREGMDGQTRRGGKEGEGVGMGVGTTRQRRARAPSLHKAESARNSARALQRARDSARTHITQGGTCGAVWTRGRERDGWGRRGGEGTDSTAGGGDAQPRMNERVSVRATARGRGARAGVTGNKGQAGWETRWETRERWAALPEREFGAACTRLDGVRADGCGRGTTVHTRAGNEG